MCGSAPRPGGTPGACVPLRFWLPECGIPHRRHLAAQLPGWAAVPTLGLAVLAADADAFNLLLEMKLKRRRERPHLPRTVTELVAEDGSRVYVVGTAHFSDDSKKDVVKVSRHTAVTPGRAAALAAASRHRCRWAGRRLR